MAREINIWLHNNPHSNRREAKLQSDAILQHLLQNALNTSSTIQIKKSTHGKPYIDAPLYFSHSNSKNLHAYVLSTEHEVGIDVEFINRQRDVVKLAQRYFATDEARYISGFADDEAHVPFYSLWSKKEAWCKLEGGNLWPYLKHSVMHKQANDTAPFRLLECEQIDGFSCVVATTCDATQLRLNAIG